MIDKNDLRVPYKTEFRPELRFIENEVRYAGMCSIVRKSRHYQGVVDLRPFGIDAFLHAYYRTQGGRNHKLELLDTGTKTLDQMAEIITSVFDVDPYKLENMRIDFAADLRDIRVNHLLAVLRVKFKRTSNQRGELDYEIIGGRRLEYFRYGKAPNCTRVYDKPAECKARFREILKRASGDAEPPTFEQTFGFREDAVITRVERQAGSSRIPDELSTFGQLRHAAEFNPFSSVEILPDAAPIPDGEQYGEAAMLKLLGTRTLIERYGYQQARAILNRNGNGKRYMDAYNGFLKDSEDVLRLSTEAIVESYRASVLKQIDGSHVQSPITSRCVGQARNYA